MKIHEYQGKEILKRFSVPVPIGKVLKTEGDIKSFVKDNKSYPQVLKAQVHSGGRGEAGGILKADNKEKFEKLALQMLGNKIVTRQSGVDGKTIRAILAEEAVVVLKEFYIGILIDRNIQKIVIMISEYGGQNIERSKENDPSTVKKIFIDLTAGLITEEIEKVASEIHLTKDQYSSFIKVVRGLYDAFIEHDASLVEINPLALSENNQFIALDSKWNFDPNGLPRQSKIFELRDLNEEDNLEIESSKYNLAYIKLDGSIGCMVNGAGLAMATMDILKLLGGSAANFLDVGGGASAEKVSKAFGIMRMHPKIKVGFINIFGGIMRCDLVAQGIVDELQNSPKKIPLVVRMKGFKELEAKKILKNFSPKIEIINTFQEAAQRAVYLAEKI